MPVEPRVGFFAASCQWSMVDRQWSVIDRRRSEVNRHLVVSRWQLAHPMSCSLWSGAVARSTEIRAQRLPVNDMAMPPPLTPGVAVRWAGTQPGKASPTESGQARGYTGRMGALGNRTLMGHSDRERTIVDARKRVPGPFSFCGKLWSVLCLRPTTTPALVLPTQAGRAQLSQASPGTALTPLQDLLRGHSLTKTTLSTCTTANLVELRKSLGGMLADSVRSAAGRCARFAAPLWPCAPTHAPAVPAQGPSNAARACTHNISGRQRGPRVRASHGAKTGERTGGRYAAEVGTRGGDMWPAAPPPPFPLPPREGPQRQRGREVRRQRRSGCRPVLNCFFRKEEGHPPL